VAELLATYAERAPGVTALTDDTGTVTWGDLNRRVNRLIHALRGLGLGAGDTIAIHSGNRREYIEIMAAAAHAGLRYVLVNWHWTADELGYVLDDSGSRVLFSDAAFAGVAEKAGAALDLAARISLPEPDGTQVPGFTPYEDLLAGAPDTEPDGQTVGTQMIYTSGTTGRPKGVVRSRPAEDPPMSQLQATMAGIKALLALPETGTTLLVGPIYHSAQWAWSFGPLLGGFPLVMTRTFDPAATLDLIEAHKITNVHLVPTQFVRMLRLPDERRAAFDPSSLVAVWHGAAPCSPEIKRRMIEWWGPVIWEYYGSTEASINAVVSSREWLEHPGTVGRSTGIAEILVLRDDGTPCDPGEPGQLWFRLAGDGDVSYWKDDAKTAQIHRADRTFTTGDVGYLDGDGYLFLTDRVIDMIVSGGVNIYPAEIEGVMIAHPAVRDVAVFGIPNEEFGEEVKAAITVEDGYTAGDGLAAELIAWCRDKLAGYKAPRSIDFQDELPRTPTGKLYKRLLREPYWSRSSRKI
jgi:long-chain acyl-CoA synthetase